MLPRRVPRKHANPAFSKCTQPVKSKRASSRDVLCLLTTRRAGDREQRWRDGSHGSLEHTDEGRREGGGQRGENMSSVVPPPSLQNQ